MSSLIVLSLGVGFITFLFSKFISLWHFPPRKIQDYTQSVTNVLGFSFSWTIPDFSASNFEELQSPVVPYHTAKWRLVLRSTVDDGDGTSKLGLYIKATGLKTPLEIKYHLSMADVKNERVCNFVERGSLTSDPAECGTPEFINTEEVNVQNGLLVNGSVTFLVEIVAVNAITENLVIPDFSHPVASPASPEPASGGLTETRSEPQESVNDLQRDLGSLLKKEELSDLTILIQGKEFSAHKAVVAVRCPHIASQILDGAVKIVFDDIDPNVFSDVLTFIYTDNIADDSLTEKGEMLLKAAEMLKLEKLKSRAEDSLLSSLNPTNATTRLVLAYECDCERLKEPILKMVKQHKNEVQATPTWKSLKNYPEILLDLINI